MKKNILIITSDPDSINYEIINKSLFFFNKQRNNNYTFIGSKELFEKNINFKNKSYFNFVDINYKNNKQIKSYLKNSFEKAFQIINKKEAHGIINLPLNKKNLFDNKYPGVTEYISDKFNSRNKETMLLYSEKFSVSPVTTHYKIHDIRKKLTKNKIINNFINIKNFYETVVKIKKPKIGILGFNPHNGIDFNHSFEEEKILNPALKQLKKDKKNFIYGLLSPDSSFIEMEKNKLHCLIGHYHDQVLTTFKYINKFNAINITLGMPFLRVSPDHGTGLNIKGKNKASPESFLCALNFYEKYGNNI